MEWHRCTHERRVGRTAGKVAVAHHLRNRPAIHVARERQCALVGDVLLAKELECAAKRRQHSGHALWIQVGDGLQRAETCAAQVTQAMRCILGAKKLMCDVK